jgi:hypothetical protein
MKNNEEKFHRKFRHSIENKLHPYFGTGSNKFLSFKLLDFKNRNGYNLSR